MEPQGHVPLPAAADAQLHVAPLPTGGQVLRVAERLRTATLVRLLTPTATLGVPIDGASAEEGGLCLTGSTHDFAVRATWQLQEEHCRWYDVRLHVTFAGAGAKEVGIQVRFDLLGPGRPTWLVPGAFYKENRLATCARRYPRYDYDGGNPQEMVSSWWAFRADRCALPAIFAWNEGGCAALSTDEVSPLGLSGIGFQGDGEGAAIWLNFPYREEPVTYVGEPEPLPPDCTFHRWQPGETVTLHFRVYLGPPDSHAYDPFLRQMYRLHQAGHELQPWVGLAQAAALAAHGLYRWHYHPEHAALYETAAFDRELNNNVGGQGDRAAMHVGWVSGALGAHALLRYGRNQGNSAYTEAAVTVLDKIASGLAPGGTFWGMWTLAHGWRAGWNRNPQWIHARTIAEATLFMLRALRAERARGVEHPTWEAAARSTLDVARRTQRADGNLGTYYHSETGAVEAWEGAGGLLWVAALLEGAALFENQALREAAQRAGAYYSRFVLDDFIYGAPEDVHLAPTSEDAYNAVIAYVLLYEAEREAGWLDLARRAAAWMMTFRWSYNLRFPPHTLLAQYDFRSRGADQASPSNQHLHSYGLVCLPEMLRLWQHTGDAYFLARTRDNLACFLQFIARADGDFNAYRGMVTERFYNTNCFQPKGMIVTLSHAWCIGMVLYACQEAMTWQDVLHLNVVG